MTKFAWLVFACLTLCASSLTWARTPPKKVPIDVLARQSALVVVGRIEAVSRVESGASPVGYEYSDVKILATLKGEEAGTILLWNKTLNSEQNSQCCVVGEEYVLFLSHASDGNYFVNGGQAGAILVQP